MESVLLLHPPLDLFVCSAPPESGHVHVFKRKFNSDILTRYVSLGKSDNRLDVARENDITGTYLIPVRPMSDRNLSTVLGTWVFAHAGTYRQTGICRFFSLCPAFTSATIKASVTKDPKRTFITFSGVMRNVKLLLWN